MKNYKIYIDDLRNPREGEWVIVRSFEEFVTTISSFGTPTEVSFDHDLGWDFDNGCERKSGYDCAKWLVENDILIERINVHSANPIGADNIRYLMKNFYNHKTKEALV